MQSNGDIQTRRPRRGGGSSVTLLFVAAALAAAAIFASTHVFLAHDDTTARFVPANAMLYAHADGRRVADAVLSASSSSPAGVHPDEVAVFIVPGDESPRRGSLLAWRWPFTPSEDERRVLDERGADALDERHYLIHDGTLATASRVAMAARASFADDRERMRALGLLRSAFPLQIYAVPASLLPATAKETLAALDGSSGPIVAGITFHEGSFMARMMRLEDALARASWFGYAASSSRADRPSIGRLDADVAAAEIEPTFDIARLLVGSRAVIDNPDPGMLATAGESLRASLASPYALWLRKDGDAMTYLAWFPQVAPVETRRAVSGFIAAAIPEASTMAMPDGDAAVEFRLASPPSTEGDADTVIGSGKERVVVGSDGDHGSLIATNSPLLDAFRRPVAPAMHSPACPTAAQTSLVMIKDPAKTLAPWAGIAAYASAYKVMDLTAGLTVDNEVVICGYTGLHVDNSGIKAR